MTKGELKSLIKECLIEILTEGSSAKGIYEQPKRKSIREAYDTPSQANRFEKAPQRPQKNPVVEHVSSMLGFKNADKLVADTIARSQRTTQVINADKPVFSKEQADLMKKLAFSNVEVSESKVFDYGDEEDDRYMNENHPLNSQDDYENLE